MTLVSEIIRDAYRESNVVAITENPTAAQQDEGLSLLKTVVAGVYGQEAGEQLDPIIIGKNNISRPQGFPWYEQVPDDTWFVPPNVRLFLNLEQTQTVYLDPNPTDGQRFAILDSSSNLATYPLVIEGNGRTIEAGLNITIDTDGAAYEYFYRADTGDWARVNPLTLGDTFPFPPEFDPYFSIKLALRINPRNQIGMDEQSIAIYKEVAKQFKARYRQHRDESADLALLRTSASRRQWGGIGDSTFAKAEFNSGRPFYYNFNFWR